MIPFLIIILIVIACGNSKNNDTSSFKQEESVNSYKDKGNTKSDYSEDSYKDANRKSNLMKILLLKGKNLPKNKHINLAQI